MFLWKNHASAGKETSTVAAAAMKPLEQRRTGMAGNFAHLQWFYFTRFPSLDRQACRFEP